MIYINLLLIFLTIIFIHELGHYTAARFFKTKVTDFSIGFGKTIFKFTDKNNTIWKISIIPLPIDMRGLWSDIQLPTGEIYFYLQALINHVSQ